MNRWFANRDHRIMSSLLTLPPESRQRIEAALAPREVVRWVAASQPEPRGFRALTALIQVLFGAGVLAAGVVVGYLAMSANAAMAREIPWLFALVGGISLILGLSDLRRQARRIGRERTQVHAVTNQRVLSYDGVRMLAIEPRQLQFVYPQDRGGGLSDVYIDYRGTKPSPDETDEEIVFRCVAKAADAVRAIERLAADRGVDISDPDDDEG